MLSGRATFTVDGSASTPRPARSSSSRIRRRGAARSPTRRQTEILVIGGRPGAAFSVSPWEQSAEALRCWTTGDWDRAIEILEAQLAEDPRQRQRPLQPRLRREPLRPSRTPRSRHLTRAVELEPRFAELARDDSDLDAIRGDDRFPACRRRSACARRPAAARRPRGRGTPGTASCSGRATRSTAPVLRPGERGDEELEPDRERERLVRELARRTGRAPRAGRGPAITSPWVTAPIETSATSGSPSLDGIAIASGFVPVSGGTAAREAAGVVGRWRSASPRTRRRRAGAAQYPSAPVGKHPDATTSFAPSTPLGDHVVADRREREVAERTVAVPAIDAAAGAPFTGRASGSNACVSSQGIRA